MKTVYEILNEAEKVLFKLKGEELYIQGIQAQLLQTLNEMANKLEQLNKEIK